MSNAFKKAAEKHKTPPGGLPEEITAGQENVQEKIQAENEVVETKENMPVQDNTQNDPEEQTTEEVKPENSLAASYKEERKFKRETRSVRVPVTLTPSLNDKLMESLAKGEIRSKNDLIIFLLERYYYGTETK